MKDPKLTREDELRVENELKALNLELNQGPAHFFTSDNAPPELVARFLDNVTRFHEAEARGELVPIRQFAGIRDLPPADLVKEKKLEPRIKALLKRLEAKGILIDRPEHLNARGYYRFLTEEFLHHEVVNCAVPGMIHGFIYSEFCHDGPEFIREHVEETLLDLLNLDEPFRGEWLSENCRNQTECITREQALESIHIFRSKYDSITPIAFQPEDVRQVNNGMYFFFGIAWEGHPVKGGDPERYEDIGISQVAFEAGEWRVQGIHMPGFAF